MHETEKYMSIDEALSEYETNIMGISDAEAERRSVIHGKNKLPESREVTLVQIFFNQFRNIMLIPLILAMTIYFFLQSMLEAFIIFATILFMVLLGTIQEFQAENALRALKKLTSLKARVIRNGKEKILDSEDIVPGDIINLFEGSIIPADCRLISTYNVSVNEAALTGESLPVIKDANGKKPEEIYVYSGTLMLSGSATGIVIRTGGETKFGGIAKLLRQEIESTPLQRQISRLTLDIGILVFVLSIFAGLLMFIKNYAIFDIVLTTAALLIAGIPESLPFIMILILATGSLTMSKKKAIVRKLISVETLGCVNYICTDKTGTLTKNEMEVESLFIGGKALSPHGLKLTKDIKLLLTACAECNNAKKDGNVSHGDPLEVALLNFCEKYNVSKKLLRLNEIPFTSERKMMSVICVDEKHYIFTKGAPEYVLAKCDRILVNGRIKRLSANEKKMILKENEKLAKQGQRTIAVAYDVNKSEEKNLIFLSLVGFLDPLRPEVKDAIKECKKAGIKVVMLTGDHKETATEIARRLEIIDDGIVLTGEEFGRMPESKYIKIAEKVAVYARINPEHKYRIVETLQKKGNVVAVTGDGVNDAPALSRADIGVAMGRIGTDVAKSASKLIISDDNFATIVEAIKEGRRIYNNIKKFTFFLLACNISEIFFVLFALALALPVPLLALQLIWLNLITDAIPAMGISVEPFTEDLMTMPPRNPKERIIGKREFKMIFAVSAFITLATSAVYIAFLSHSIEYARTSAFCVLALMEIFFALSCKSLTSHIFKKEFFNNPQLFAALISSIISLLLVIYIPSLQNVFLTVPLALGDLLLFFAAGVSAVLFSEALKILFKNE